AAADRNHRVDGFEPGLQRLLHRAPVYNARRVALDRPKLLGVDRTFAVDGLPERIDDAAYQGLADRHLRDAAGAADDVALLDRAVVAQQHGADVVFFEVEHHPDDVAGKLQQLARHRLLEPVDACD